MRRTAALVFVGTIAACGGSAVIDPDAGVGGSSTTTTTSTTSTTTTSSSSGVSVGVGGGPTDCGELTEELTIAIEAASACDSCTDGPDPCTYLSGPQLTDPCGCPQPVNGDNPDATAAALQAYDAWIDLGCGPLDCGEPCAISQDPSCLPTGGCDGVCSP